MQTEAKCEHVTLGCCYCHCQKGEDTIFPLVLCCLLHLRELNHLISRIKLALKSNMIIHKASLKLAGLA